MDLLYGAAMFIGILGKEVWDETNTGSLRLSWPRLVGALVVSPVVYATVYAKLAHDATPTPLGLAVAFQNGFFWQSVLQPASGTSP